jgi:glycosyltransferase involved in cell wall biosynthesis
VNINLIGPCNSLGYGITVLNIIKALMSKGHNVCFYGIGQLECPPEDINIIGNAQLNCLRFNPNAPSLRIYHPHDMALHAGKGLHVGFPIFELTKFTNVELHQLKTLDCIFTTSQWGKSVLQNHGLDNIHVVPLGVDRSIFNEDVPTQESPNTVFLNCGKWEIRKGHDILLEAFNKAFTPDDNVQLIMHCYNPFITNQNSRYRNNQDWEAMYMHSKLGKHGKIFISKQRSQNQHTVALLMARADCGVFPARAEGWNLELLEMLSMGKAVIATNYSAHTEFLNSDNSLLINIKELELAEDNIWFHKQGEWARFDRDQLIEHMRIIHSFKQMGVLKVNTAGITTAKKFSWQNTASAIIEGLQCYTI